MNFFSRIALILSASKDLNILAIAFVIFLMSELCRTLFVLDSLFRLFSGDVDVTELWEWREGRLLAYELILKYLITNHIHYTFPAYTLTRAVVSRHSFSERYLVFAENFGLIFIAIIS